MRMRTTGKSSDRYGPCEVCGQHASEVWIRRIHGGSYVFGHRECVELQENDVVLARDRFRQAYHGLCADDRCVSCDSV